jgi:(p)ppGpp synthase/HD superfamily hydrolase
MVRSPDDLPYEPRNAIAEVSADGIVSRAVKLAKSLHEGQTRKSTSGPYFDLHLLPVADLVYDAGGSYEVIAASLGHDILEDCINENRSREDLEDLIRDQLGETVLSLIKECTEIGPGGEDKAPWVERKLAYLKHLKVVSAGALLISVADKLQSARDDLLPYVQERGDAFYDIFKKAGSNTAERKENTLWFHRSLVDAFGSRLEALRSEVSRNEYQSIAGLIARFDEIVESLEEI